jgi:hypothetical protein
MDKMQYSELLLTGSKVVNHIQKAWMLSRKGQVHSACAIGMMAVARAGSLDNIACRAELDKLRRELVKKELKGLIIGMNDQQKLTPEEIAAKLKEKGH